MEEEISLTVDPSEDKVLGVFGEMVHIRANLMDFNKDELQTVVVKTSKAEYLKMWINWLEGKQSCCEIAKEYCGVLGEFETIDFEEEKDHDIYLYELEDDGTELGKSVKVRPRVFIVTKFDDYPQFEHG